MMSASVSRPKFTTSASANKEKAEERAEKLGSYFGDRVKTVSGEAKQSKSRPISRPCPSHEPLTHEPAFTHLRKPKTDRQKNMSW